VKVLSVFGTRPEAIKLAPVVQALAGSQNVKSVVCVSAQHRDMLDQVLQVFGLKPEHDLDVMRPGQDLPYLTGAVLQGVVRVIRVERPDWVVVQGDTTTAFAAALAGFYERVHVAHVEAGLRTHDMRSPWPEEGNRRLIAPLADMHFAPTPAAMSNLVREGIDRERILVTGNTVIDALRWTVTQPDGPAALDAVLGAHSPALLQSRRRWILVTLHRRENFGERLRGICESLRNVARERDVDIVFPVHPNPAVREVVDAIFEHEPRVHRLPPLDYLPFVALLSRCHFVVTDSGGIQEEAPGLAKPVLVARDTTERPEAIEAGTAELVGTDGAVIAARCLALLDDEAHYLSMSMARNPFGDGHAAARVVERLLAMRPSVAAPAAA